MLPGGSLPDEFAAMLVDALDPADAEEAAALIFEAAALDEAELAAFLEAMADRLRASPEPVRAAEIRSWLAGGPPEAGAAPPPR